VTYTSLSADKGARAAAMHIAALVQLLQHRANPKQQEFKPLQVVITPDAAPNAFIRKGSELRVTSGMLKHLATPADAAFIVAHELAHLQLQHTHNTSTNEEIVADSLAVMMLERAEISACNAPHLLARILAENGRSESIARRRIAALLKRISATCAPKQKIS
jgi:Zn-dependent protease with chaperone function